MKDCILVFVFWLFCCSLVDADIVEPGSGLSRHSADTDGPIKHVIVYKQDGRFCGWPANNGAWSWGNEILVCFELCYFKEPDRSVDPTDHHVDWEKLQQTVVARSMDGGLTWKLERPEAFAHSKKSSPPPGNINFAHPDFALRAKKGSDRFHISYDRGRSWQGPYKLPDFGTELSARTDYVVDGKNQATFFLSAAGGPVCVRTIDGGKTFNMLSMMRPAVGAGPDVRSIMPSTVRISQNKLVCAVRQLPGEAYVSWIDVFVSGDNGTTWKFLNKVADADRRYWNGNPPSLVKMSDGRLCVTYGYRAFPYGIRAKISSDSGRTWCDEIILRQDGRNWDLGYTRTVERPDGKLVTIYYYSTKENTRQYIAATIWDPDAVNESSLDRLAFAQMAGHIEGIEKSINQIITLSQAGKTSVNQIVWWIQNKEEHANRLNEKIALYFMGQRLKPTESPDTKQQKRRTEVLNLLQKLLFYSNKAKQFNSFSNVRQLKSLLEQVRACYFDRRRDIR